MRFIQKKQGADEMIYEKKTGVPKFECTEYEEKTKDYVVLIPIINE